MGIFWKQAMVYVYTLGRLIFLVPFKKARMEFFLLTHCDIGFGENPRM